MPTLSVPISITSRGEDAKLVLLGFRLSTDRLSKKFETRWMNATDYVFAYCTSGSGYAGT